MGKFKLSYDNQFIFMLFIFYLDFFNFVQCVIVFNEGLLNVGQVLFYIEDEVEIFCLGFDFINYFDIDWKVLMFNDYGFQQCYNFNFNGGSEKVRYFVFVSFLDQGFNYMEDVFGYQQFNLWLNINVNIIDNLILDFRLAGWCRFNEAFVYLVFNIFWELSCVFLIDLVYYLDGIFVCFSFSFNYIFEGICDFNVGYYWAWNNNIDMKLFL